jgi:hypothetical protein
MGEPSEPTKKEVLLAIREQLRQLKRQTEVMGKEAFSASVSDASDSEAWRETEKAMSDFMKGDITSDQLEVVTDRLREENAAAVRAADDPVGASMLDAENEIGARGLPRIAELLTVDAAKYAGSGFSKEKWISDVLTGHLEDVEGLTADEAQLGCLKWIVTLWSEGPWPFLRT